MTELKIQKNVSVGFDSTKSKRDNLNEILKELLIKGKFDRCILCDDKGMIFSDVGQSDFHESAVGGMFALIHNVIKRTIENLDLVSLDILKIRTFKGIFLSSIFKIDHYNRSMILTAYYNEVENFEIKTITSDEKIPKNKQKPLKPKISLFNLLKLYLKSKQRKVEDFTLLSQSLFDHDMPNDIFNILKLKMNPKFIQNERNNEGDERLREISIKDSVNLLKMIFEN